MGRFRGGPAKAAVVASCAMGSISGSSIANTVTTGAMTIPLMKKVGFKNHVAGAVEVHLPHELGLVLLGVDQARVVEDHVGALDRLEIWRPNRFATVVDEDDVERPDHPLAVSPRDVNASTRRARRRQRIAGRIGPGLALAPAARGLS